jgi:WD40 repeat protein
VSGHAARSLRLVASARRGSDACTKQRVGKHRVGVLQREAAEVSHSRRAVACMAVCQVLLDHADEVWQIQFSHNGRLLASASKDGVAITWDARDRRHVVRRNTLRGHKGPIAVLAWSPDDSMLVTCGEWHDVCVRHSTLAFPLEDRL